MAIEFLSNIGNFFGSFWDLATDFITLIFVIIYAIMFFVIQYYLIKMYIFLGTTIYEKIPFVNSFIDQKFHKKNTELD